MSLMHDAVSVAKNAAVAVGDTASSVTEAAANTYEAAATAGSVTLDAWITARVKTRLVRHALLQDSDITVVTSERVVTLTGTTASSPAMLKAAAIARGSRGVERIVNHLGVKTT